jgi:hypothetical protein
VILRDARLRGVPIIDANMQWTWPELCEDDHDTVRCFIDVQRERSTAPTLKDMCTTRLQAVCRRMLVQQEAQHTSTFCFVSSYVPDEWEYV